MNFNEYHCKARQTALYPNLGNNFTYPALGLCGESGEVADKLKKIIRDKSGILSPEDVEDIKKELGDVLWYISALCSELGISLDSVAETNIEKLYSRQERNQLQGSGDNR